MYESTSHTQVAVECEEVGCLYVCWWLADECRVQLYTRGHVELLGAELCDLDVFARLLKVNDKRFVCSQMYNLFNCSVVERSNCCDHIIRL